MEMMDDYEKTITREEGERYNVPLLWKDNNWQLESNDLAAGSLLRRLRRTLVLLQAYDAEMSQLVEKGFVEEAELGYERLQTYIPHQPVIREDKKTTKIRPVFDGSMKARNGPVSVKVLINQCLESGPNLTNPYPMAG